MFDKVKKKIEAKIEKECKPLIYNSNDGDTYREIMIENHRRLWKWIMWRTIIDRCKEYKSSYFKHYNIDDIEAKCFLCEYVKQERLGLCNNCPMKWKKRCGEQNSLFQRWYLCGYFSWITSAYYAWRISRVREKKEE